MLESFGPLERRDWDMATIFNSLHRLINIIKFTESGKDDIVITSKTKETLRERVLLEMKSVAT